MKIRIYEGYNKNRIEFNNDAKGIRGFIRLLNKMFIKNGIKIYVDFELKNRR